MAKHDPLDTVLKLTKEAEAQAGLQLKSAQLMLQKCQSQLEALRSYRLDYMKQIENYQGKSISASYYHQFHQFVRQIDEATTKQMASIQDADTQRIHRQQYWLEAQQKRKAVELLLSHKAEKKQQEEQRQEQKMIDEFAIQQLYKKPIR
ncbi:flagellar export protein FliJ [Shewanella sp. VB17]|uniref:flagellar export protein FliJ n=1 Tax=Shewanella sp. VB17 TaxID=2739432 RepID=UPI0015672BF7|nr:flagellar export protein FliJ [Shewanella sp. VB17]NRD73347.1 flagellar export protein FliJ [Shewanella sp. VB17]